MFQDRPWSPARTAGGTGVVALTGRQARLGEGLRH
jgi:hypothetical protein